MVDRTEQTFIICMDCVWKRSSFPKEYQGKGSSSKGMDIRQTRISDGDNILVLQMDNLIAGKLILILFLSIPSGSQCSIIASVPPSLEEKS